MSNLNPNSESLSETPDVIPADRSTLPPTIPYSDKSTRIDIFSATLRAKRQFGASHEVMVDVDEKIFKFKHVLRGAFALGSALRRKLPKDKPVGVMLPTGAGSAITFLALQVAGRLPAMLNFTAGSRNIKSALTTAQADQVLTSRRFVELGGFEALVEEISEVAEIIYLEDVKEGLTLKDKLAAIAGPILPSLFKAKLDYRDPAVVLFTSGTEGDPKGVVLSHRNLVSNVQQVRATVGFNPKVDAVFNPLPIFHCFGLTVGVVLPLIAGVRSIFHPTPLQPKEIVRRIAKTKPTFLIATDTFVSQYARAGKPEDFKSLRLAVCGAERVRDETRQMVRRKIGMEILEGYGATEAAPIVSVNPAERNKPGTVGKIMPDMEMRLEPVQGISQGGKLQVRGPNVMVGYMYAKEPGVIVPPVDGWHDTGDIVVLDDEDYIRIRGRVKRFAKLGGEMVSLAVVENCASSIWPDNMHAAAVLPHPKKGEQVVLLSDAPDVNREEILAWAQNHGVSELAVPAKVYHVPEVPLLGTGKLNYGEITKMAAALLSGHKLIN